mmetsp:Transcript_54433/g.100599  ORF Transcript_54433/g.100599 Transcript_54433/m.100599 type:complete len:413 (+) Transcript_54433:24-1262(+)
MALDGSFREVWPGNACNRVASPIIVRILPSSSASAAPSTQPRRIRPQQLPLQGRSSFTCPASPVRTQRILTSPVRAHASLPLTPAPVESQKCHSYPAPPGRGAAVASRCVQPPLPTTHRIASIEPPSAPASARRCSYVASPLPGNRSVVRETTGKLPCWSPVNNFRVPHHAAMIPQPRSPLVSARESYATQINTHPAKPVYSRGDEDVRSTDFQKMKAQIEHLRRRLHEEQEARVQLEKKLKSLSERDTEDETSSGAHHASGDAIPSPNSVVLTSPSKHAEDELDGAESTELARLAGERREALRQLTKSETNMPASWLNPNIDTTGLFEEEMALLREEVSSSDTAVREGVEASIELAGKLLRGMQAKAVAQALLGNTTDCMEYDNSRSRPQLLPQRRQNFLEPRRSSMSRAA